MSREQFIAEVIRRAGTPSPEVLNKLRGLLPPVSADKKTAPAR